MEADDDRTEGLRVGRWVPDEESARGPDSPWGGENTLGRRFPWPEEIRASSPADAPREDEPPSPEAPPDSAYMEPLPEFQQEHRYRGLRRADGTSERRLPVLAATLVAVTVALAVLIVVASMPGHRRTGAVPPNGTGAPGMSAGAGAAPQSPTPSAPASTAASPAPTTTQIVPPPPVPTTRPTNGTGLPQSYEAEAPGNVLTGSAWIQDYPGASGGQIIRNIGNWGGTTGPGTLTFPKVMAPADGVYVLTFFYVHLDNVANRTAVITIGGVGSFTVTVTGNATCCANKAVAIPLRKGPNSITFGNPNGHAPSIDKIIISLL